VNNKSKISRGKKRLIELRESLIRLVALFGIAILGFWIPAIPAGMTTCVDVYAASNQSVRSVLAEQ